MVYLWRVPDDYPQGFIGFYGNQDSPDRLLFQRGRLVPKELGVPHFRFEASFESLRNFDVLPNNAGVPLISPGVASLMEQFCSDDIQLIKCAVKFSNHKSEEYFIVNILNQVACLDKARSRFSLIPGTPQIMGFTHIATRPSCLGAHHIGRESEYTPFIFVSEHLKLEFERHQWIGYSFVDPEKV
jgi:hypothetical protein